MKYIYDKSREGVRLSVLRSLNILDTPREGSYDRVTRLLYKIFDAPIAAICLVDDKRGWLKAVHGADWIEIPRDQTFCEHIIYQPNVVIVPDTLQDERFSQCILVTEYPHIRSFVACPLTVANGIHLGGVYVYDTKPRDFNSESVETLKDMTQAVLKLMKARLVRNKSTG